MRHSGHKERHKVWVFMATIRQGLAPAMPWAQKASKQQCRSQAIMPRLSGQARWCTKQLRAERAALGLCRLRKLSTIMHACDLDHQALVCACGDETRAVLEQIMFWNGQLRHNKQVGTWWIQGIQAGGVQKLRTTQTRTKNACLPDVPPGAVLDAAAAFKDRQTNISL